MASCNRNKDELKKSLNKTKRGLFDVSKEKTSSRGFFTFARMASKRSRAAESLIEDTSMNPLHMIVTTDTIDITDIYATRRIVMPTHVGKSGSGVVIEILSLDWYFIEDVTGFLSISWGFLSWDTNRQTGQGATLISAGQDSRHKATLGFALYHRATTGTGGAGVTQTYPIHVDTSDGFGRGILFAGQSLTLVGGYAQNTSVGAVTCSITYRLKTVSMLDYIRIAKETSPATPFRQLT